MDADHQVPSMQEEVVYRRRKEHQLQDDDRYAPFGARLHPANIAGQVLTAFALWLCYTLCCAESWELF